MIDNFAILLTHGLMLLAAWRLLARADLDDDSASAEPIERRGMQRRSKQVPPDA